MVPSGVIGRAILGFGGMINTTKILKNRGINNMHKKAMEWVHVRELVGYKGGSVYNYFHHNGYGGGFSNGGETRSWKKIVDRARSVHGQNVKIRTFKENVFEGTRVFDPSRSNF